LIVEISISALEDKTVIKAFKDNEVIILKEFRFEWHHPRLADGGRMLGFFAVSAASKIFREYKQNKQAVSKGSVVY
jgi:hypothetical protein